MEKDMQEIVLGDSGMMIGVIYATSSGFEAWHRERLVSSPPGNKHTMIGVFDALEKARLAVKGREGNPKASFNP